MKIPARTTKAGNEVPAFQVDDCFAEEVLKHSWIFNGKKNYNQYLKTAIKVDGKWTNQRLHQFIWNLSGREPAKAIDHINGDVTDNRLENLRACTHLLNTKNNTRRTPTKNGLPVGISFRDRNPHRKYEVRIDHRKKKHYLGYYANLEEAVAVYQNAKEILIEFSALPGYEDVING